MKVIVEHVRLDTHTRAHKFDARSLITYYYGVISISADNIIDKLIIF